MHSQSTHIPRSEYPRPQFERADWLNLNGIYNYDRSAKFDMARIRQIFRKESQE